MRDRKRTHRTDRTTRAERRRCPFGKEWNEERAAAELGLHTSHADCEPKVTITVSKTRSLTENGHVGDDTRSEATDEEGDKLGKKEVGEDDKVGSGRRTSLGPAGDHLRRECTVLYPPKA